MATLPSRDKSWVARWAIVMDCISVVAANIKELLTTKFAKKSR
jgi:hypothetical protein